MRTTIPRGDMYLGQPFNSVNDVVVRQDGQIYFTDPSYQRGQRPGQPVTASYRLPRTGPPIRIAERKQPNGINLSPDGKWLYVASSGGDPLRRHPVAADGTLGPGTDLIMSGSDGMAVDCAGNLYLTTGGQVHVYSPGGMKRGEITGFSGGTTNAAFGGEDAKTLLITGGGTIYRIALNVPGLPN